jgi:hypothetical protein
MSGRLTHAPVQFKHHHLIIGETEFALMAVQAVVGVIHHVMFLKRGKRLVWTHLHVWLGRTLITLGIINGGIGMQLGELSTTAKTVYGVFAGLIWTVWIGIAVYSDVKEFRKPVEENRDAGAETAENKEGEIPQIR